jgi:hypothetical protein
MRYVAVSQPTPWSAMEIIGVGDSMDEAYSGARAWFENAFDKFGEQRWNELVAMQNNLNAVPETVLHEKTGVTLDEWLARLASTGQSPGAPQPPKPPMSPVVTKVNSGWEPSVWILAAILIIGRPILNFGLYVWDDLQGGDLSISLPLLVAWLLGSVIMSIAWSAAGFWVFRWFKDDATLADYLFALVIVQIAGLVVSSSLGFGQVPGLPSV